MRDAGPGNAPPDTHDAALVVFIIISIAMLVVVCPSARRSTSHARWRTGAGYRHRCGSDVSDAERERTFEPFYRARGIREKAGGGGHFRMRLLLMGAAMTVS